MAELNTVAPCIRCNSTGSVRDPNVNQGVISLCKVCYGSGYTVEQGVQKSHTELDVLNSITIFASRFP